MLSTMKYVTSTPQSWNHIESHWHMEWKSKRFCVDNYLKMCLKCYKPRWPKECIYGAQVLLNNSSIMAKSSKQEIIILPVTEAKLYIATSCAKDMLFVYQLMQTMEIKVKITMILKYNTWLILQLVHWRQSLTWRCLDVYATRSRWNKIFPMKWIKSKNNLADLGTKSLNATKHTKVL